MASVQSSAISARRGFASARESSRSTPYAAARWIDRGVLAAVTLSGLFVFGARVWFTGLVTAFVGIAGAVLAGAWIATLLARHVGARIQKPSRTASQSLRGALDTSLAAWIAACLLAWPLARLHTHHPIGLVWTLPGGSHAVWRVIAQTVIAIVAMDAWLYWKHRLLHTRWMFGFHRAHHVYRDPDSFASFAVGPVESVLTFWPILILCHPAATHWAPLYFALVAGFILLNLYLHCGITLRWVEATLPRAFVNTSAFHNVHHANAGVNYGEALTLWDSICRTREGDVASRARASG